MEDLEKQIEEAANNYCENFSHDYLWQQTNVVTFKRGAKSPEVKEYWQQGMYSEEEVKLMLRSYFWWQWENEHTEDNFNDWFDQNKKKQ